MKRIKDKRKRVAPPHIITHKDKNSWVLEIPCNPVPRDRDVSYITAEMIQALRRTPNGVGLAASQIGYCDRIFVMYTPHKNFYTMINPEIHSYAGGLVTMAEGCLSYPGIQKAIPRSKEIWVTYEDSSRTIHNEIFFKDVQARIIQHEIDHLDGLCKVSPNYSPDGKQSGTDTDPAREGQL